MILLFLRSLVPFNAVRSFITNDVIESEEKEAGQAAHTGSKDLDSGDVSAALGLSYHINIVLPETKDVAVFNAIFQSLRQNLLR